MPVEKSELKQSFVGLDQLAHLVDGHRTRTGEFSIGRKLLGDELIGGGKPRLKLRDTGPDGRNLRRAALSDGLRDGAVQLGGEALPALNIVLA